VLAQRGGHQHCIVSRILPPLHVLIVRIADDQRDTLVGKRRQVPAKMTTTIVARSRMRRIIESPLMPNRDISGFMSA
jgi:hypothetical protein